MSVKRVPNEDMPATAISFKKETLDLLRRIANREGRSLASQVRTICEDWLQSPEGIAAIQKSEKSFDLRDLVRLAKDAPSKHQGRK